MNNIINNWSYSKPTEPGEYFMCCGDVEVKDNVEFQRLRIVDGVLRDGDGSGYDISRLTSAWKFARLVYSPVEIKEIEG